MFLAEHCPQLSTRAINPQWSAKGSKFLQKIAYVQTTYVRDISMRGCLIVNDDLAVVAKCCPKLVCIELRECPNIADDEGLAKLVN